MFRHFHRKEDLFWVALESRLKNVRVHEELQAALSQGARPDIAVPMIMELMVRSITNDPELVRLLSISVLELRHGAARICREHLAPICKAIDEYLVGSIERGSLRALDPSLISAAFAVTAIMHSGVYQLLTGRETPYCNANEAISAYSKFWLEALAPSAHQDTSGTPR
jgi:AcrR family transcriptional regulator